MKLLSEVEIKDNIDRLSGWSYENNSIQKTFVMADFANALAFVVKVGLEAEKNDHHPDMLLHAWNKVTIKLSTHSVNGITGKDFNLAHQIERLNQ